MRGLGLEGQSQADDPETFQPVIVSKQPSLRQRCGWVTCDSPTSISTAICVRDLPQYMARTRGQG
jgi:hypothetical protein